ncbi:MAG TPA: prepilin-type N-terminal cleavage/methylation domain-containing protein [Tepidisphaeraceae bacterium]|nr:prepilin-type N-terminal cleavage/methylation domain-containing protein [Tepidisphaeraceae bacterium]
MKIRPNQSRGFTLIELIVSMMMVALLAGSLYSTLNVAYRAKRSAERAIVPVRAAGIAADVIARDLDSVVRPDIESSNAINNGGTALFVRGAFTGISSGGTADEIIFSTNGSDGTPDIPLSEGIRQVDITLDTSANPPQLVRQVTRNVLSMTTVDPDVEVLCKDVKAFSVSYMDGYNQNWYSNWDSTTTAVQNADGSPVIPSFVQFEIVLHVPGVNLPGEDPDTYRITRIVQIPAAEAVDASQAFQP